jgi:hypothetical protein
MSGDKASRPQYSELGPSPDGALRRDQLTQISPAIAERTDRNLSPMGKCQWVGNQVPIQSIVLLPQSSCSSSSDGQTCTNYLRPAVL